MAEKQVSPQVNSISISETETEPSSSSATSATISLISFDGIVFKVDPTIAKEMETVQAFIDESDGNNITIPLPNVSSHYLPYIIEYCKKSISGKIIKELETEFVKKLNNEEVKELLRAANYLNIKKLQDFLSQAIADRIANKSVEYVRRFFGTESDYPPEEEAMLREQFAWSFAGVDPDSDVEN